VTTDDQHRVAEASEADLLDQERVVGADARDEPVSRAFDVPEADAIEQAIEVPLDPDEEPDPGDEATGP
jgi:hypothetical protein